MNQASRTPATVQAGPENLELTRDQLDCIIGALEKMSTSAAEAIAILTDSMQSGADEANPAIAQAEAYTGQTAETIQAALRGGDLRSLARHDLDAWRRGVVAAHVLRA